LSAAGPSLGRVDDLARLAIHEASHIAVSSAFGDWAPGPAVATRDRGCYEPVPPRVQAEPFDADLLPLVAWPADLRRFLEADVCISLAGQIGEGLFTGTPTGRVEGSVVETAREIAELPPPSTEDHAWAARKVADDLSLSDVERVARSARIAFVGDPESRMVWLRFLELQTTRLLVANEAKVRHIGKVLANAGVLSAEAVKRLLDGHAVLKVAG